MDIVTGYQGKEHVKADQLRRLISGMAGDGTYVLETQNKLAATMVTANQVRINTGDLIAAGGAYATVETPETLTIESGATGQKRIDLVVARYKKDASKSVESMELDVVKGTPVSYGDPTKPEIAEGSIADGDSPVEIPLYSILIDGLAPGAPEQLFESAGTIDSLRDLVSQHAKALSSCRTYYGTKVITGSGTSSYVLLQKQELDSLARSVGARNSFPAIAVTNGDWNSKNFLISGTLIQNNAALIWLDRAVSGAFRIDYAVTFPV